MAVSAPSKSYLSHSEEDTLVYNRWESQPSSSGIGLGNLGGDVGVAIGGSPSAHVATFSSNREFYSMDFNKDGHADLIDESTGTLLLNRGNNRFLVAPQSGRLYPRDLNGDFIMDYICYDEETQTVESMVFQKRREHQKANVDEQPGHGQTHLLLRLQRRRLCGRTVAFQPFVSHGGNTAIW